MPEVFLDGAFWPDLLGQRFLWLALASALAGLVRGFSGFGAAMIFLPLAGLVVTPAVAVPLLFVADNLATLHITLPAFRRCAWSEILPLAVGAALTIPFGVLLLVSVDPQVMRWAISLLILLAVALLASGWRLKRTLSPVGTAAVGSVAGLAGGAASLYGPPMILFWLGGQAGAAQVRVNILAVFGLMSVVAGLTQWLNGLLTLEVMKEAMFLLPVYAAGAFAGTRLFGIAGEAHYRRVALGLCAVAALAGLPLWQSL